MTAAKTDTRLGAMYRRIARKRGKQKAIVAVARVICEIAWILICDPSARYIELGPDYYHPPQPRPPDPGQDPRDRAPQPRQESHPRRRRRGLNRPSAA